MNNKNRTIGVLTLLGKDRNYGGALQAYALHKKFETLGYASELIKFEAKKESVKSEEINPSVIGRIRTYSTDVIFKKTIKRVLRLPISISDRLRQKSYEKSKALRFEAFDNFRETYIPQTKTTYIKDNINQVLSKYDFFVCGSDQVWNPVWYNEFHRMEFVPDSIPKFSYAASISADSLTNEQRKVFRKFLSDYIGISVREKQAVELLQDLSPVTPVHSLDPTLLLDKAEWDTIVSDRQVKEPYMFCYFLDCGEKLRKLAKKYAKKKGLRVVCIPYATNHYNRFDIKYSNQMIQSASPANFISLIKHADIVLTDSFHASVFSSIYEKEFFAFRRYGATGMSARIETLTQMFNTHQRFCNTDDKETIAYMEQCPPIDYSNKDEYLKLKEQSVSYLKDMLEKSEQMVKNNEI